MKKMFPLFAYCNYSIVYLCYTATILFIPLINEPWRLRNKEVSFLSMFLKKIILMLQQHMQKRTKIRIFFFANIANYL